MSAELALTTANFEEKVLKSPVPVLVDFWAEWCMPCRMVGPFVEQIAKDYEGKLTVGKLNVDEEEEIAARYNITSIPTFIVFKDGKVVNQRVGGGSKQSIEEVFKSYL